MTNITFNLDNNLIQFIKTYSKENNISQKQIIEEAIKKMQINKIKKEIRKESIELWKDNKDELLFLANSGLKDYNN
jgi:hypothetical protein